MKKVTLGELPPTTLVQFFVAGDPKAKGSMQSMPYRSKDGKLHVNTFNASKSGTAWERATKLAAIEAWRERPAYRSAVSIKLDFVLVRPKTVKERKRPLPIVKPDIDKLTRSVLDALAGVTFSDDALVTGLSASKRYGHEGEIAGVFVEMMQVEEGGRKGK